MSGGNIGPVPTRLVFLSELPRRPAGDKVRFLGCVSKYHVETATLTLHHPYPPSETCISALVNVDLLLSTLKASDLQVGEWLNIMGYVTKAPRSLRDTAERRKTVDRKSNAHVQAIMVWSAGAVKLGEYERTLEERKEVEDRLMQQK